MCCCNLSHERAVNLMCTIISIAALLSFGPLIFHAKRENIEPYLTQLTSEQYQESVIITTCIAIPVLLDVVLDIVHASKIENTDIWRLGIVSATFFANLFVGTVACPFRDYALYTSLVTVKVLLVYSCVLL